MKWMAIEKMPFEIAAELFKPEIAGADPGYIRRGDGSGCDCYRPATPTRNEHRRSARPPGRV